MINNNKSNPILRDTIVFLQRQGRKKSAPVWQYASRTLSAGSSKWIEVNVGRISRVADAGSPVLVPGKVLGTGTVDKKLVVGAYSFSTAAKKKITDAGGDAMELREFVEKYPDGSGVKVVN
jgi:large subunit ribosomal protein L18e